jgi:putative ABC transport system permease protein
LLYFKFLRQHANTVLFYSVFLIVACVITVNIAARVIYEFTYDQAPAGSKAFRLQLTITPPKAESIALAGAPRILERAAKAALPDGQLTYVEKSIGALSVARRKVHAEVLTADADFLNVLPFRLEQGDRARALAAPGAIVLQPSEAVSLFGTTHGVVGRVVEYDGNPLRVTGVFALRDAPSHIPALSVARLASTPPERAETWFQVEGYLYVSFPPAATTSGAAIERSLRSYIDATTAPFNIAGIEVKPSQMVRVTAVPINEVHFGSQAQGEMQTPTEISDVAALAGCGLVFCLVACSGFGLGQGGLLAYRVKEIALRQILGGSARSTAGILVSEFVVSVVILIVAAWIIDAGLSVALSISSPKNINSPSASNRTSASLLVSAAFLSVALLAYLPSVLGLVRAPPHELVNCFTKSSRALMRASVLLICLVSFLCALAMTLAFALQAQAKYVENLELGFDRTPLTIATDVDRVGLGASERGRIVALASQLVGVAAATEASAAPGEEVHASASAFYRGESSSTELKVDVINTDAHFVEALGARLLAGRSFAKSTASDRYHSGDHGNGSVIVNESLIRAVNVTLPDDVLGRTIELANGTGTEKFVIVGVIKDLLFLGARQASAPTAIVWNSDNARHLIFRAASGIGAEQIAAEVARGMSSLNLVPTSELPLLTATQNMDALTVRELEAVTAMQLFSSAALLFSFATLLGVTLQGLMRRRAELALRRALAGSIWLIAKPTINAYLMPATLAGVAGSIVGFAGVMSWLTQFAFHSQLSTLLVPAVSLAVAGGIAIVMYVVVATFCASRSLYRELFE